MNGKKGTDDITCPWFCSSTTYSLTSNLPPLLLLLCLFGFSCVGPTSHRIAWVVLGSDYGVTGFRIGKSEIDRLARGVLWNDIQGLGKRKISWCQENFNE